MRQETDFVLEQAAWPALLLEESGTIRRANRAARQVFGDAMQGPAVPLSNLWGGNDLEAAQKFLGEAEQKGTCEVNLQVNSGEKAGFIAHVTRVGRDGQTYLVLQLFKESGGHFPELTYAPLPTATTTPAPAPAKADNYFRLLNAAWPTMIVEKSGKVIQANLAAAHIFGKSVEMEGASLGAIWSPENKETMEKFLAKTSEDAWVFKLKVRDGAFVPFQAQCCSLALTGAMLVQFIKDGKEPVSSPPAESVNKTEEEFVLMNAEWPAMLVQKTGKIIKANRAAVRAFGPSIERDESQFGAIWSPENKESANQFLNLPPREEPIPLKFRLKSGMSEVYAGQICVTASEDICLVQLLKEFSTGGNGLTAANSPPGAPPIHPLQAAGPLPPGATAFPTAVESNLAHKQKLDCALQLARSVSLDFNNALTSILGHASLLLSKTEANNPWRNSLVEIEKSASRAAEIANDLAAFSRQEKDVKVQHAANLNSVLERCVEAFRGPEYKDITWTLQFERKLFTANFDEAKMQQAMVKILENAVQVLKGFGKISVQTRNLELSEATQDRTAKLNPGNYVCAEISDNGEGIPNEVLPRIFEPFFTTKSSKHRGLGLAFVYGIVTNHGGGVAVSSQPGIGTSVRVYLPSNNKIVRDTSSDTTDLSGKETILIVDDEDLLLTMGQMVLSSFGYTVLTANSGQKALDIFSKATQPINLVITDLVMPNMSGRELTEHILKIAPHTRIIWSSGYVRSANAVEEENYLQKPFTSQELLRKVKNVLADEQE